jgi:2-polyprenyl-3-methyl-5-hydroxy-6-metoxy-1,4-benzoquinol methylase
METTVFSTCTDMTRDNAMNREAIIKRLEGVRAEFGPWKRENILLPHGIWTREDIPPQPRLFIKRIIESIIHLYGESLEGCRILDLAPGEGASTVECVLQGAHVTVIEARRENLERIRAALDCYGMADQADLQLGDVRKISPETHGYFDIILCCGILYHLTAEGVYHVVSQMGAMAKRLVFIDTHISLSPDSDVVLDGVPYRGWYWVEHDAGTPASVKEAAIYSSIDNERSFWFSRVSLINMLMRAGFPCVAEVFNTPMPDRPDRCSITAIQGDPVPVKLAPEGYPVGYWNEGALDYGQQNDRRQKNSLMCRIRGKVRRIIRGR